MEDVIDMENELTSRLSTLQKKLDKNALNEVSKDVTKVQELIKANLQRSKVIQVKKTDLNIKQNKRITKDVKNLQSKHKTRKICS